jgi:hypothetical protein
MVDIFISYSTEDRARIRILAQALIDQGWSVFWDRTIKPGQSWKKVIGASLKEARCVVVAWSRASVESEWVSEEAMVGKQRQVLIPLNLDPVEIPFGFGQIQSADMTGWHGEMESQGFLDLVDAIAETIGSPAKGEKKPVGMEVEDVNKAQSASRSTDITKTSDFLELAEKPSGSASRKSKAAARRVGSSESKSQLKLGAKEAPQDEEGIGSSVFHFGNENLHDPNYLVTHNIDRLQDSNGLEGGKVSCVLEETREQNIQRQNQKYARGRKTTKPATRDVLDKQQGNRNLAQMGVMEEKSLESTEKMPKTKFPDTNNLQAYTPTKADNFFYILTAFAVACGGFIGFFENVKAGFSVFMILFAFACINDSGDTLPGWFKKLIYIPVIIFLLVVFLARWAGLGDPVKLLGIMPG